MANVQNDHIQLFSPEQIKRMTEVSDRLINPNPIVFLHLFRGIDQTRNMQLIVGLIRKQCEIMVKEMIVPSFGEGLALLERLFRNHDYNTYLISEKIEPDDAHFIAIDPITHEMVGRSMFMSTHPKDIAEQERDERAGSAEQNLKLLRQTGLKAMKPSSPITTIAMALQTPSKSQFSCQKKGEK